MSNFDYALKYNSLTSKGKLHSYKASAGKALVGKSEYVEESAVNANNFGENDEIKFRIGRSQGNRLMESISLTFKMNAGTHGGGSLNYIEGTAPALCQWIDIYQKGRHIDRFYQHQIFNKLKASSTEEDYAIVKKQIGLSQDGNISANNQTLDAESAQTFVLELNRFIDGLGKSSFPVFLLNDQELEIRVKLTENFNYVTDNDADTTKVSINDMYIVTEYVDPGKLVIDQIFETQRKMGTYFYHLKPVQIERTLESGKSIFKEKLSELKDLNVVYMDIYIIKDSDLDSGKLPWNYQKITGHYNLKSKNTYLNNCRFDITDEFYRNVIISDQNPANASTAINDNIYQIAYTNSLKNELQHKSKVLNAFLHSNHGVRYFVENDCILNLEFDSNLGSNHTAYIDVWTYEPLKISNGKLHYIGEY